MKCIIAGSRSITDYGPVVAGVEASGFADKITEVVCGGAPGVDRNGQRWAEEHGIEIAEFAPDWSTYGKAAGPFRNEAMAKYADALVLVWDGKSKGSADMLRQAKKHGLKVYQHIVN